MTSPHEMAVGLWSLYGGLFIHFNCGKWEGYALKPQVNYTSRMTVVAPNDRPKSVRNSCVIKRILFVSFNLCFVCRLGMFVIRLRQISFFFSPVLSCSLPSPHLVK